MGQGEEAGRAPSQASQAGMSVSGRLVKAKTAVLTAEEAVTREGTGRRERGIPRSSPQLASPQTPSPTKTLRMNGPVRTRGPHHCVIGRLAEAGLRFQTRLTSPSKDSAPPSGQPWRGSVRGGPPTGLAVSSRVEPWDASTPTSRSHFLLATCAGHRMTQALVRAVGKFRPVERV